MNDAVWVEMIKTVAEDGLRLDGVLHPATPAAGSTPAGSPPAGSTLSAAPPTSSLPASSATVPSASPDPMSPAGGQRSSALPFVTSLSPALPNSMAAVDGLICLHGVGSNFYGSSLFEALTPSLTSLGVPVAWVNTRGRDNVFGGSTRKGRRWFGAAFEIVGECSWDVAGWLTWAQRRGWRRVGLVGHSLGAIKAVFSQAQADGTGAPSSGATATAGGAASSLVTHVAALSPPRLCYRLFQNDPAGAAFFEAITTAKKHLAAGDPDALIRVQYPYPLLISAGSYVDKYGPGEQYDIVPLVPRLQCSTLFTYGASELETGGVAFAGVPEAVRSAARSGQPLTVAVVPGADHNYTRCAAPLAEVLRAWLTAAPAES